MTIGVFDSGLGGLTVFRTLRARLPWYDFVFFGDNINAPIGPRSEAEIDAITTGAVRLLLDRGCDLVILACNTACAVSLRRLQEDWLPANAPDKRVLGVFVPMIEAVTGRPWGYQGPPKPALLSRVALFATAATCRTDAFRRELRFRATGLQLEQEPCHGLVDAIEAGDLGEADRLAHGYAEGLLARMPDPQAAILGCTHYPIVEHAFRSALPESCEVLSQPRLVAESLADYLRRHPRFAPGTGQVEMLTSGDPGSVADVARLPLGRPAEFGFVRPPG